VEKKADAKYKVRVFGKRETMGNCSATTVSWRSDSKRRLKVSLIANVFRCSLRLAATRSQTVSAASIAAKVARDEITSNWVFSEKGYEPVNGREWNSGYPSDPQCKKWLQSNLMDPVFGFPDVVRFSWAPAKLALEEVRMGWKQSSTSVTMFLDDVP
jgi:ribonuclease HII